MEQELTVQLTPFEDGTCSAEQLQSVNEWYTQLLDYVEDWLLENMCDKGYRHMQYLTPETLLRTQVVQTVQEANAFFEPVIPDDPHEVCNNDRANSSGQTSNAEGTKKRRLKKEMGLALAKLLHHRFGHCSRRRLVAAATRAGLLHNRRLPAEIPCLACDRAKAKRRAHTGTLRKAMYPYEIIHCDLLVINHPDVHGNRYSLQFVDDKTGMPYSYPLKEKSLSGQGLMAFLARCKCSPGEFRVDAGGEFVSKTAQDSFMQVCYRNQIHVHRVIAHEHQANGKMIRLITSKILGTDDFDESITPMPIINFGNLASVGSLFAFNLDNDLEPGQKGVICSFGAGYSVCSIIVEKL